ncbi:MAG: 2'-deoxycytidine 5'-triphosphate deaminase [Planctomycetes bacterium]|nr:2'-deoxycytidine 5'-triphosphate deaminase [Planctomycetota bacterium]
MQTSPTYAGSVHDPVRSRRGHLLVDREIAELVGTAVRPVPGASAIASAQLQASSLDLRLGPVAYRIRAGFLPGRTPIAARLAELETSRLSLEHGGAVLEKGLVYLVPLEEELVLPADLEAAFNPRSSTGRCDVFTRVLVEDHPRFHAAPAGYRGKLWLEVAPLSFPVRLVRGDRLAQARFFRGEPALSTAELRALYAHTPLCYVDGRPVPTEDVRFDGEGGLELHLGLKGRDPSGWRAQTHTGVLDFGREAAHAIDDFWEAVHSPAGHSILTPGSFYLFASRERVVVPPEYAAEMLPVDVDIGEMRNNYAGFFDNGFGWDDDPARRGTPAVLEVRAHDVPFLVEDGQVFFRLRYYRTSGAPAKLYAADRATTSYRRQDLTPARCFRPAATHGARRAPDER